MSTSNAAPRQFSLIRRSEPGRDAVLELRALLKRALRQHGLRCLLCAEHPAGPSPSLHGEPIPHIEGPISDYPIK